MLDTPDIRQVLSVLSRVAKTSWRKLPWKSSFRQLPHQFVWKLAKKLIVRYWWTRTVVLDAEWPLVVSFFAIFLTDCCFKAVFAKTFSPPDSEPASYRDQLSMGTIHPCGDKTTMFRMLYDRNRKLLWNICLLHSSLYHSYSSVTRCRTMLVRHSRHHQRVRVAPVKHRPLALHRCQSHVIGLDHVTNRQFWIAWGEI